VTDRKRAAALQLQRRQRDKLPKAEASRTRLAWQDQGNTDTEGVNMSGHTNSFDWNDKTITRLRELWDEGHPTAEIGRRLGITKNAVVGKAHRLELPGRPSPIRGDGMAGPRAKTKKLPAPRHADLMAAQPLPRTPAAPALPPPVLARPAEPRQRTVRAGPSQQCCWPVGEPGRAGFRFCDAPVPHRVTYCDEHARLAYVRRPSPPAGTPADAGT